MDFIIDLLFVLMFGLFIYKEKLNYESERINDEILDLLRQRVDNLENHTDKQIKLIVEHLSKHD